ncbi:integrase core domain-containing protein [Roseivivax halodurans]|uniref:integrase core domain-containing protein n=1 Tax=Roseivivax halodurans TaxID=93683 RepID=UPI003CC78D88
MLAAVVENHTNRSLADLRGELVRRLAHDGSSLLKSWSLRQTRGGSDRLPTASSVPRWIIGDWIAFYNTRRPHQALGMKTPAATFELAA